MSDVFATAELAGCSVSGCNLPPLRVCDWKAGGAPCGKSLCAFHAYSPAGRDEVDLCPEHAREWKRRLTAKGARP